MTGASNVTGEVWPVGAVASVAHRYGARLFVDAAQLAAHRVVDMAGLDIDWVAFSGHKLYAPFGAGALVGRTDWLAGAGPYLLGGGAVQEVDGEAVTWAGLPDRHEGGSPNVVGAVALGAACRALCAIGMDEVAELDRAQANGLQDTLEAVPDVELYSTWGAAADRVAVRTFQVRGFRPAEVAAVLSAEHGIGMRSGSFCAHPLLDSSSPRQTGAARWLRREPAWRRPGKPRARVARGRPHAPGKGARTARTGRPALGLPGPARRER